MYSKVEKQSSVQPVTSECYLWIPSSASEVTGHLSSLLDTYDAVLKDMESNHLWRKGGFQRHRNGPYECLMTWPREMALVSLVAWDDLSSYVCLHIVSTHWSTSYQRVVRRRWSLNFVLPISEYKDDLHCPLWHKLIYSPRNHALTSESRQVTGLADRGNPRSQRRLVKGMQEGGPHPGWAERSQAVLLFMTLFYFRANITPVRLTNLSNDSIKISLQYQEQMSSMRSGNVGAAIGRRLGTWNWIY